MESNFTQLAMAIDMLDTLPTIDQVKTIIVLVFSGLVGIAFIVALGCMVYFLHRKMDTGIWQNVFLTCLGYIVGILTGLLGVPVPTPTG
jgi:uncharacterized membrane protein YqaE (UPF0057 family)